MLCLDEAISVERENAVSRGGYVSRDGQMPFLEEAISVWRDKCRF
jgi:hypothetical protein